jgi:ribonuclease P protein component
MSQPPPLKTRRLKKRAEFLAVASKGAKAPVPGLVMQLMPRADDAPFRVGFTVTKKVGNAVVRNRTKRRLREAVRLALDAEAYRGFDMVVIGRDRTADRPFADLMADVRRAAAKARQLASSVDAGKGRSTP